VIPSLNGVLHRTYEGALGELRAHQLSSFVLLVLLAPWAIRTECRHPLPSLPAALQVGLTRSSASVAFEFPFGHHVNKRPSLSCIMRTTSWMAGSGSLTFSASLRLRPRARPWRIRGRSRRPETSTS
jgi:hypothetical protein